MVEITLDSKAFSDLLTQFAAFENDKIRMAIMRATQRAATHTRKKVVSAIRRVYAMKAGDIKKRAEIKSNKTALATVIKVRGPMESVKKYRVRVNKRGVFVAIKKGAPSLVSGSFSYGKRFMARLGKERLPIHDLYGPSVPQLFGNPHVQEAAFKSGMETYEKRLRHELERLVSKN